MSSQAEEDGCRACRWREANPRFTFRLSLIRSHPPISYSNLNTRMKMFLGNFNNSIISGTFQIIHLFEERSTDLKCTILDFYFKYLYDYCEKCFLHRFLSHIIQNDIQLITARNIPSFDKDSRSDSRSY